MVAATIAWLPLQYLIATAALHKLYHRGQVQRPAARPAPEVPAIASVVVQQATVPASANGQRAGVRPATLQLALELAAIRDKLALANYGKEPAPAQVAELAGVSVRTARRLLGFARQVG